MEESILITIKQLLGIEEDATDFDLDIITHINSTLSELYDIGYGLEPFKISGEETTWDLLLSDTKDLELIKEFIYISVKMVFDPPLSSIVMDAYKEIKKKCEFKIYLICDKKEVNT